MPGLRPSHNIRSPISIGRLAIARCLSKRQAQSVTGDRVHATRSIADQRNIPALHAVK
jgi:hypothetical protein